MLAAIRKHKAVVIAILLAIVIVAPAYYFLMPRGAASLPVITATNATTVYDWTENFSNTSVAWFFLNGTFDTEFTNGYLGYIYANSTMHQKGYPESHLYVNLEAEYSPQSYSLDVGVNVTGYTYLSPSPNELNISFRENLPGAFSNVSFVNYWINATTVKDTLGYAQFTLNNGSGIGSDHGYRFCANWGGSTTLFYPLKSSYPYLLKITVSIGGLYAPVTSTFIVNFTDVKS